jgi:ketol-acid reductoisomerase
MQDKAKSRVVKKTVAIHPIMDGYIRKTWSMLIEAGYDATYSSALNFMLLAMIMETTKEGGLSDKARDTIWEFARDQATITELNLQEHLANLREYYQRGR